MTCEENVQRAGMIFAQDHGYNFEVPVSSAPQLTKAVPLRAMGRFNHEAIAVDPRSGVVYQTEDRDDSLLYRFIPTRKGQLAVGGRLQALRVLAQKGADTRNWQAQRGERMPLGRVMPVTWVDLDNITAPADDLRVRGFEEKGAARFARGEGIWCDGKAVYFACTSGGSQQKGQIWRYILVLTKARCVNDAGPRHSNCLLSLKIAICWKTATTLPLPRGATLSSAEDSIAVKMARKKNISSVSHLKDSFTALPAMRITLQNLPEQPSRLTAAYCSSISKTPALPSPSRGRGTS